MSELKTNLEQILQEKTTKLIPENIKRKVEIFDVTGTDGDAEVTALQAQILETRQEIADTRRDLENSAATVTGTGENVTLNQTAEATLKKLGVGGNSEQESTTGRNLWINEIENGETVNGITATRNADGSLTFNGTATDLTEFYFVKNNSTGKYLELNQPYTLSGVKNSNTALSSACIIGGVGNSTTNDVRTITLGSTREITKNNSFIRFNQGTVLSNYTIKPFIEIGTTQGEYEPYTNGASPNPDYPQEITNVTGDVEVKVQNKNLWNTNFKKGGYDMQGNFFPTDKVWITNSLPITINSNTQYTITQKETPTSYRISFFNNETYLSYFTAVQELTHGYKSCTFTTPANCNKIYVSFRSTKEIISGGTYDMDVTDVTNVQLEVNSIATDYVEHQEQAFTFPLGNEKLMLGDYLADDGIHHVRGQVSLNNTSKMSDFRYDSTLNNLSFLIIHIGNCKKGSQRNPLCNQAIGASDGNYRKFFNEIKQWHDDSADFVIGLDASIVGTTVTDFRTHVEKKPLIIEYELEEEVIVPYTSAQQEVYDAMKRAISYEEQTNVSSLDAVSPIFTVTAFKDADLVITSLDNQLTLKE